jgi:hypothetical protein
MGALLFFVILIFVMPMIASVVDKILAPKKQPGAAPHDAAVAIENRKEKRCPPHAWFSQEVRDSAGNKLFDRTVCKWCGPLRDD